MAPDADLQLNAVIKALTEAVTPAVDPSNDVAQEQMHLSIATLGLLRDRLPMTRRFYRALAQDSLDMADLVSKHGQSAELDAAKTAMLSALNDPAIENDEIENVRSDLIARTTDVIAGLDDATRKSLEGPLIDASAKPIERERAWFIGSGFEPNADRIPAIETLI